MTPHDFNERKPTCKTKMDYLKSATVLLLMLVCAIVLFGVITKWADQVKVALNVEDAALSQRDTKAAKEMRNEY
jgi:hypothetical protein